MSSAAATVRSEMFEVPIAVHQLTTSGSNVSNAEAAPAATAVIMRARIAEALTPPIPLERANISRIRSGSAIDTAALSHCPNIMRWRTGPLDAIATPAAAAVLNRMRSIDADADACDAALPSSATSRGKRRVKAAARRLTRLMVALSLTIQWR